jgi:peptidylprolyl isomerase
MIKKMFVALVCLAAPLLHANTEELSMKKTIVVLETNLGSIEIALMPEIAPKTCENFLGLIGKQYYDGLIFHRIIKNFMIQGGDPTGTGAGGESLWGKSFGDECVPTVKFDKPGLLAMANRGPNTNGSQFFITTAATPWLNMKHTIFGEVVSGQEIVKKLDAVKTGPNDRPVEAVRILKAYVK